MRASEDRRPVESPHNIELEQALLGAIMLNSEAFHRVADFLEPQHFFEPLHQQIFTISAELIRAGKAATPIALKTFLPDQMVASTMTIAQYLARLAAEATTVITAVDYGRMICDLASRRRLVAIGEDLIAAAIDLADPTGRVPTAGIIEALNALSFDAGKAISTPLLWHGESDRDAVQAWLIKYLLPEQGSGLLAGQWGTAKTFTALDLAGSVMTGQPFAGRRVARQGGVLFIATEGSYEIPVRTKGLVDGKLGGAGPLPFVWTEQCPRLLDGDALARLEALAKEASERMARQWGLPLALIIIDTMSASAGFKDESSSAEGQAVMNVLAALGGTAKCCVLAVDHFGKMVETGTRGTSAKEGAADFVLALLGDREQSGGMSNLRMAVRKLRGGRTGAETAFSLRELELGTDRDGEAITTCIIDWADASSIPSPKASKSDGWTKALITFRRALMAVLPDHGREERPWSDGPVVRAVDREIVRGEFYRIYATEGDTEALQKAAKRKAFNRSLNDAADKNLIGLREIGGNTLVWLATRPEATQ